jgi:hypothetical protein
VGVQLDQIDRLPAQSPQAPFDVIGVL